MRIPSLALCALLGALTPVCLCQVNSSPDAMQVQTLGITGLGPAEQGAVAHFNVYLPLTRTEVLEELLQKQADPSSSSYRQWLTPAQFKVQFGPSRPDVARVTSALLAAGFTIVAEHTQSL
jgi:subtilase family serine protease